MLDHTEQCEKFHVKNMDSDEAKSILNDFKQTKKELILFQLENQPYHLQVKQFFFQNGCYQSEVVPVDNKSREQFGDTSAWNDPTENQEHRPLEVSQSYPNTPRGKIAHEMKSITNALSGVLQSEILVRYDMINFHIREGYVPFQREHNFESLQTDLAQYRIHKNRNSINDEPTFLKYDPPAAKKYWQKIVDIEKKLRQTPSFKKDTKN